MRQLVVDARDRVSGTTSDFSIQLPETPTIKSSQTKMRIDSFRYPVVIPLVQTGVNDKIYEQHGGLHYCATLTPGNFSGTDLATNMQSALQAAVNARASPGTWTVAYSTAAN